MDTERRGVGARDAEPLLACPRPVFFIGHLADGPFCGKARWFAMTQRSDSQYLRWFADRVEENRLSARDLPDVLNWMLRRLIEPPAVCRRMVREIMRDHSRLSSADVVKLIRLVAEGLERDQNAWKKHPPGPNAKG